VFLNFGVAETPAAARLQHRPANMEDQRAAAAVAERRRLPVGLGPRLGRFPFVSADIDTRPVGPKDVPDLARLFESQRTTRRCWCMAFCVTPSQFAAGWLIGGNQQRFGAIAAASSTPMGILASWAAEPVGWCACGPRSRYVAATGPRSKIMRNRARDEDEIVWLLPCLFVRAGHRGQGVTHVLVRAAVELARREGASAIEGWPLAGSERRSDDAFLGREQVFEDIGFSCVGRPSPERVIMRLELSGTS
jgi:GNAT superfamily N-acetyltransferase